MTSLALSDRDMLLVRDIVACCSDVSREAELLPGRSARAVPAHRVRRAGRVALRTRHPQRGPQPGLAARRRAEPAPVDAFWDHFWDSDCSYPDRTGDLVSVTMTSDFYSLRELHNTGMYADYLRYWGIEHELMVVLPPAPGRTVRLLFSRGAGRRASPNATGCCSACCARTCRRRTSPPSGTASAWPR